MPPTSFRAADLTDSEGLAETRVRFLSAEPVEPARVRDTILASWRRSRGGNVAADHIEMPYIRDPDLDTPLTRSAGPVLRLLCEQLTGQPISVVLTNQAGLVLSRLTPDADLERHLDAVQLAPGFSYAEQFVGTNGIGTALEGGKATHVFGHEHYAENLEDLACAGVPIQHPISGKTVGLLDLTCWRKDAGPLLIALAKTTAGQIRQALLSDASTREVELLHEYLRACRRTPGIVFALNNDVVMMNDYAQTLLGPADQSALLRQAAEAIAERRTSVLTELPSGTRVRMYSRPVGAGRLGGGVVHVRLVESSPALAKSSTASTLQASGAMSKMLLPGLVGGGALWRRACDAIERVHAAGDWVAVEGEAGVGKLAILRAVHQRRSPGGRFSVLSAAEATDRSWSETARRVIAENTGEHPGSVVIRHIDALNGVRLRSLAAALTDARRAEPGQAPWVAVTYGGGLATREFARLLQLFPQTVEVPPLRHHVEDVQQLVPFFLSRLADSGQLTCSTEVLQLLMRSSWPGNIEGVFAMLRGIVAHRRTGAIQPSDLPPETHTMSRRLLSPLESIERDAIVRVLIDSDGNKAKAARSLGMSRATIYRKIHEFGIVATAH
jgi:sigma-54 dependent transcriptional regulator, acetoin dehydrogenase operon transcriptional activator AcoR